MNLSGLATLVLATLAAGCTAWHSAPDPFATPIPQREPVQIWSGGRSVVVHGVERRGDSIRAIPRWRPPTCDSCALRFPLTGIDSVRTRRYSAGRTFGLMGGAAVALMIYGLTQIPPGVP